MVKLSRSLIFVPANNPRFLKKARSLPADIVCLDLEDSVPDSEKAAARKHVLEELHNKSAYSAAVFVRINAPDSGMINDDLAGVLGTGLDGIVIPKVDSPVQLKEIEEIISRIEKERGLGRMELIPSIESALGVVNCYSIASSSERIRAIVFGVFDLLNDMNIYTKQSQAAQYSRMKIPLDAAAARVAAIDAIWQDIKDSAGLKKDCTIGKSLGYSGKSIIHPSQIPAVHEAFHPSTEELDWARRVCEVYLESAGRGSGATSIDGKMIDEVHYKQAKALLDSSRQG